MKYFIIFILLTFFLAFVYLRLRPYIRIVRQMFGVVRNAQSINRTEPAQQPLRASATSSSKLVRCDACNTWIPASRAVKLRSSSATYCSHACLESSATTKSQQQRAV